MILKIVFAIVCGAIATGLMEWLTSAPHGLDVLVGIAVAILAFWQYPTLFNGHRSI